MSLASIDTLQGVVSEVLGGSRVFRNLRVSRARRIDQSMLRAYSVR